MTPARAGEPAGPGAKPEVVTTADKSLLRRRLLHWSTGVSMTSPVNDEPTDGMRPGSGRRGVRERLKTLARIAAMMLVAPMVVSFWIRAAVLGRDRALEGSTQALALLPGVAGQYLRRAFLGAALARCHPTATICFGTMFSRAGARLDEDVYVGPGCHVGLVHLERDVLIGAGVHLPSGGATHGTDDPTRPIREQKGAAQLVRIGHGAWIGSTAVIMADVGHDAVVGAGSIVTRPVPPLVVAAGVPAKVVKTRTPLTRAAI